jgi:uncharacterized membrane protein YfcA
MEPTTTLLLACVASLFAGFVDAIVGGGGLIQLPALLLLYPNEPIATLLSVNKAASCAGTLLAFVRFRRHLPQHNVRLLPGCTVAFVASGAGAYFAVHAPTAFMRGFAIAASLGVVAFTLSRKNTTSEHKVMPQFSDASKILALALGVGFYDGFFGPGTGSFFVFGLVALIGMDFLHASANAKALNLATNLAAIAMFATLGHFNPQLFGPLAVCNILGSYFGSQLAIKQGAEFVRLVFLGVVFALITKMAWELLREFGFV